MRKSIIQWIRGIVCPKKVRHEKLQYQLWLEEITREFEEPEIRMRPYTEIDDPEDSTARRFYIYSNYIKGAGRREYHTAHISEEVLWLLEYDCSLLYSPN